MHKPGFFMLELLLAATLFMVFAVALTQHVGTFLILQQGNGLRIDRLAHISDALERPYFAQVTRKDGIHRVHCEHYKVPAPAQCSITGGLDEMLIKKAFDAVTIKRVRVAVQAGAGLPALSLVTVAEQKKGFS